MAVLIAGVIAYGMVSGRQVSTVLSRRRWDKLWQLLFLGPAIGALALMSGALLKFDIAGALDRVAGRLRPWTLVFLGLCVLLAVAAWPMQRLPGSRDEAQYLFQGRALAAGSLSAPPPACVDAFALRGMVIWNGRWITPYEPGHPLLLGLADRFGLAWAVGPLTGALSLWLLYFLAAHLHGAGLAVLALAIGAISPFFVFLAACHSYHVTSLALSSFVFLAVAKAHGRGNRRLWDWCVGVAVGALFLVRPLAAGILLVPIMVVELSSWKRRGPLWARWGRILLGAVPLITLWLFYNHAVTGHALCTARQCIYPNSLLGFGDSASHGPSYGSMGHNPAKGARNLLLQSATLSTGLFGWPLISLIPAMAGFWCSRRSVWSWAFALAVLMTGSILFFSWYSAVEHGPRHYLDSWPGLVILSALGIRGGVSGLRRRFGVAGSNAALAAVGALFLVSFVLYVPMRVRDLTDRRLGVDPRVHEVARQQVKTPAVVFMQCPEEPADYYTSGFIHNDPFLRRPIIYARHISPETDRACLQRFPGRSGYLLRYDPHSRDITVKDFGSP
ncbi:glycosyltransferase family 39 protein [Candidatus Fermentibacteria bacterium]|nr:glycosyltransferase family 39 protein [Candidatus Fermentibacteria bacterium]